MSTQRNVSAFPSWRPSVIMGVLNGMILTPSCLSAVSHFIPTRLIHSISIFQLIVYIKYCCLLSFLCLESSHLLFPLSSQPSSVLSVGNRSLSIHLGHIWIKFLSPEFLIIEGLILSIFFQTWGNPNQNFWEASRWHYKQHLGTCESTQVALTIPSGLIFQFFLIPNSKYAGLSDPWTSPTGTPECLHLCFLSLGILLWQSLLLLTELYSPACLK